MNKVFNLKHINKLKQFLLKILRNNLFSEMSCVIRTIIQTYASFAWEKMRIEPTLLTAEAVGLTNNFPQEPCQVPCHKHCNTY